MNIIFRKQVETQDLSSTHSDQVLVQLRGDILEGSFAPSSKLGMKELCERYMVSMSPLREALNRLAGEGFVQASGRKGFSVPPLTLEDLEELTALRRAVEDHAIRQAVAQGNDAWEARIVSAFHQFMLQAGRIDRTSSEDVRRYDEVHRDFHLAIFSGSPSPRTLTLVRNLYDQAFRYRQVMHGASVPAEAVIKEHRELMDVVLSRDVDAAAAMIGRHLNFTLLSCRRRLSDMLATRAKA